ncbi:SDR family NAD(P)-dependent oxidoreductase [Deinococcus pimensis]|uniref:SDR family NAD(P)-dependent oxidoreductase n=1 Tax=Deinococcus pimensis TaxID=309888 RepID=UPI00048786D4|nr:SDR family oxidoreductase [Deinococcus pimensis]
MTNTTPSRSRRPLALVTGASGGIGEEIARELAANGHDVVLVARSTAKLDALAEDLRVRHHVTTHVLALDLTAPDSPARLVEHLAGRDLHVDVLVNNAGFATYGEFHTSDLGGQLQMIGLNVTTLVELTHRLLPGMLERRSGRVLNVASTAAFMPGPLMATYYATKAFVLSFGEALAEELRGSGVTVTTLCPGPVETGFQARANLGESRLLRSGFMRVMDAASVAREGVRATLAGRRVVVTGLMNQVQAISPRFLPRGVVPGVVRRAQARAH